MTFDKTRSAGVLAGELARLYGAELQARLAPLGLQPAQFLVLSELWVEDGQTQRALTGRLGVEQATMANTLARMERDHLVTRAPHPDDRRSQLVWLTDAARELEAAAVAAVVDVNQGVLEGLPAAERELFLSMLGRVVSAMRDPNYKPER
ncbi:MAG: MarR family transcriptional regulator [Hoeflea sp.]|uniref:MarR family winged helix-turn-helix transcriptional regulator n=1 Tax=Hoeflea sp. TaxID=1940281 RepID=UPI001DFD7618|nr:MarR family transcriptional regulator [Hoeflea sp.]MBU4529489.1 MarR family transcriptional regulator [Alphaproteobacteria bacterium]MBU4546608.1 MarR family transcriptional regulator [Alphaproteobacteria bacterium]MBU4550876.1 MarR family transcriptional regulator [Alphaproteobacteria bacterium]MBV1723818.1 MarR family transcriptional regulator [Hoeflea sp.]MBV1763095.1 MarR family transcriptional regulator [Hoeflea sp.]